MDSDTKCIPPWLTSLSLSGKPNIVGVMDTDEDETFKQFTNDDASDSPDIYFDLTQDLSVNNDTSDSLNLQQNSLTNYDNAQRQLGFDNVFSVSLESSPRDSSSDSSLQRRSLSNSSGPGGREENISIAIDPVAASKTQENVFRPNSQQELISFSSPTISEHQRPTSGHDFSFKCRPESSFRFNDADPTFYSPSIHANVNSESSPVPGIVTRGYRTHDVGASAGSNGSSPLPLAYKDSQSWPVKHLNGHPEHAKSLETQSGKPALNSSVHQQPSRPDDHSDKQNSPNKSFRSFYSTTSSMPAALSMSATSSVVVPSYKDMNSIQPTLRIHQKHDKSRVETQIPIKLILYPMPFGVSKLHLPPHTVSKPKQLADPAPARSSDTLELDCTLVCTTAMRDEAKRRTALAHAAGPNMHDWAACADRKPFSINGELKPCDGGKVRICSTCITREEKRASRKKAKVEDRAGLWQKLAEDRVIIFNSNEVVEWQDPSEAKSARTAIESNAISGGFPDDNPLNLPPGAKQIDLPMRIACYCRHQDEKLGFQVIFTLKNYRGICVAQSITDSITITDDHKTSTTPVSATPQSRFHPENIQLPGAGVFSQEFTNYGLESSKRQAQSFSNQQATQFQQPFQTQPGLALLPRAPPRNMLQSTTTPHSLSRQASPSAPSGPHQKKRKPSNCGIASNGLAMTRLDSQESPRNHTSGSKFTGLSIGSVSRPVFTDPNLYGSSNGFVGQHHCEITTSMPARYNTNPPTPIRSEASWPAPSPRSQSMEDIPSGLQMPITPPGSMSVSQGYSSSLPRDHMESPASATREGLPGNVPQGTFQRHQHCIGPNQEPSYPPNYPQIQTIAPLTGSVAGGIEIICLGTGFYPGVEIVFGDTVAAIKSYLGETSLICILPPATHAASVPVRCNHDRQEAVPWLPAQQTIFTYVDDNELQILRLALTTLNHRITGRKEDARKIARDTINGHFPGVLSQDENESQYREQQQRHQVTGSLTALTTSADFEGSLLGCLDIMDLDDSPIQPRFNSRGPNGQSMLHLCASLGYYRFAAALLARGANPDLRDRNGMSPMHMASLNNHPNIIRKLRSAGGDPMLRSLRGLIPADLASTKEVRDVFDAIENFSWPEGIGSSPISHRSRASSTSSSRSYWRARSASGSVELQSDLSEKLALDIFDQVQQDPSPKSHIATPCQSQTCSRRNSTIPENSYMKRPASVDRAGSDRFLVAATVWSAWRDQLITQVQVLQQTVHRSLPALPMPTLPPIPNLPDYQAYPVVRRISSLVPQRYPRALYQDIKESDYHWWELLRGSTAPPAYEELYPSQEEKGEIRTISSKGSALASTRQISSDTTSSNVLGNKFSELNSILDTVKIDHGSLTSQQHQELMTAHAIKVKRLRSDRKLFFFWIPLLIFVLFAMLKDRVAQLWFIANSTRLYLQSRFQSDATTTT